jgi:2-keto-4-pentenoate hydratase
MSTSAAAQPDGAGSVKRAVRIGAAAAALERAHRMHAPFDALADAAPADVAEAYAIQDEVARRLWTRHEDRICAWKTGGPNARATPIAAPIPASRLFGSGASLDSDEFHFIAIEAELAYTLERDLPPRAVPYTETDLVEAIRSVHAAIEICDSRLANYRTADALWKLADNQSNGALVVGPPHRDWRRIEPGELTASVEIDAAPLAQATGTHPYGDPLRLLPWLANHCATRRGGLRAGDVITTGAWTGMHFVAAGAQVVVRFTGLAEARAGFGGG